MKVLQDRPQKWTKIFSADTESDDVIVADDDNVDDHNYDDNNDVDDAVAAADNNDVDSRNGVEDGDDDVDDNISDNGSANKVIVGVISSRLQPPLTMETIATSIEIRGYQK